jgi:hypothetical protein
MAEVLGAWEGFERQLGAVRQRLLNKHGMDSNLLAEIRARLEAVLEQLVADGRVWVERPMWWLICMLCWRRSIGGRRCIRWGALIFSGQAMAI